MYDVFLSLLEKNDIKTSTVAKETGISNMTFSDWKNGKSTPKADKLQKIADFFGVSIEYLMTGEEKENTEHYYYNEDTRQTAQDIFESKELRMLFSAARDATPEDLNTVHTMLLALKRKERGDDDTGC